MRCNFSKITSQATLSFAIALCLSCGMLEPKINSMTSAQVNKVVATDASQAGADSLEDDNQEQEGNDGTEPGSEPKKSETPKPVLLLKEQGSLAQNSIASRKLSFRNNASAWFFEPNKTAEALDSSNFNLVADAKSACDEFPGNRRPQFKDWLPYKDNECWFLDEIRLSVGIISYTGVERSVSGYKILPIDLSSLRKSSGAPFQFIGSSPKGVVLANGEELIELSHDGSKKFSMWRADLQALGLEAPVDSASIYEEGGLRSIMLVVGQNVHIGKQSPDDSKSYAWTRTALMLELLDPEPEKDPKIKPTSTILGTWPGADEGDSIVLALLQLEGRVAFANATEGAEIQTEPEPSMQEFEGGAFLYKHCVSCHGLTSDRPFTAEKQDPADAAKRVLDLRAIFQYRDETIERVQLDVNDVRVMPKNYKPRPDSEELSDFIQILKKMPKPADNP